MRGDDLRAIVWTPFWSVLFGQWLILHPTGAYLTGCRDAEKDARDARVVGSLASGFALAWAVPVKQVAGTASEAVA